MKVLEIIVWLLSVISLLMSFYYEGIWQTEDMIIENEELCDVYAFLFFLESVITICLACYIRKNNQEDKNREDE